MSYQLASSTWGKEEIDAIERIIKSGKYTMGEEVRLFEDEFAKKIGSKYGVMFNSGSSANLALVSACRYLNEPVFVEDDEIIVPAVSWSTTYYPVSQLGAKLVFVDINIDSLNIDPDKIIQAITKKTKAIFVVNLLGNPADWVKLQEIASAYNLILLEDNCESMGASLEGKQTGTFGIGGTFSFFFSHHISTMEGGMVVTDDLNLYETLKSTRAHGWVRDLPMENTIMNKGTNAWENQFKFVIPGYNLRPLEIEAAIGREQIRKLDAFIDIRRKNADFFLNYANSTDSFIFQKQNGDSSWFGFSIILKEKLLGFREKLLFELSKADIESRPIVSGNFTRNPTLRHLKHRISGELSNADRIHDHGLFVGNHHFGIEKELSKLFEVLEDFKNSIKNS